jgi:hypothetical protein
MKIVNGPRLLILTVLVALAAVSIGTAAAQASYKPPVTRAKHPAPPAKVAPKTRKASSFAPRPTKRRVFGAPIQPPIVHPAPPKPPK